MVGARTVLKDERADSDGATVLVVLSNPGHVDQLLRTATDLTAGGEVLVVSVIHKPVTSPFLLFSEGHIHDEFDDSRPPVLERASVLAEDSSVPIRRHLLVGSDVSEAILTAQRESDADAILLGWQDRARPSDIVLGATVDRVVGRAPCNVYVERVGTTADRVERVLLPTVGGPHLEPATELVEAVARANDADVTVVSYVGHGAGDSDRAAARDHVERAASLLAAVETGTVVESTDDVAGSIVTLAADHDLVVLGATRERALLRPVVGSVAETVAREAAPPVVIAKRRADRSLLGRVLHR
jgi:nucleotide-binding universal stress UspA family protein